MLALLLALSPATVATQTAAPADSLSERPLDTDDAPNGVAQSASESTTTVLTLGTDPEQTGFDSSDLSLGSTLAMERENFRTRLNADTLDQRLDATESDEKKKQLLNLYRYQIENRIISLSAREREARQSFNNGTMSATEFARTLGIIHTRADHLRTSIEAMRTHASSIPQFRMKTEADSLKGKLTTLEGPVRERIGEAIRGESSPTRVYVSTADTGVVLSTIVGDTYVREVTRYDRRNPAATGSLSLSGAQSEIIEQYPWAWNNSDGSATSSYGATNVYQMSITHSQGTLVAFLDGGTESVFEEIQHRRLSPSTPTASSISNTSENVTLTINRTYPGGPAKITLTNATGAPLDGAISVAGERVGTTGSDGVLWTLGPSKQFRVSATHDFVTVNQTVTPTDHPVAQSEG